MSLFPDEDVLTKEIESWRGFIEKLPSDEDKAILTELLNDCYKYSIAMNPYSTFSGRWNRGNDEAIAAPFNENLVSAKWHSLERPP
jgi:hypothetical protein